MRSIFSDRKDRMNDRVLNLGSIVDFQAEIHARLGDQTLCSVRMDDGEKDFAVIDVEINHSVLEASRIGNTITVLKKCQKNDTPVDVKNMRSTVYKVPEDEDNPQEEYAMVFERDVHLCRNKKMQRLQMIHAVSDAIADVYHATC